MANLTLYNSPHELHCAEYAIILAFLQVSTDNLENSSWKAQKVTSIFGVFAGKIWTSCQCGVAEKCLKTGKLVQKERLLASNVILQQWFAVWNCLLTVSCSIDVLADSAFRFDAFPQELQSIECICHHTHFRLRLYEVDGLITWMLRHIIWKDKICVSFEGTFLCFHQGSFLLKS